ncbi:hypothetical protein ACFPAA_02970, partial [Paraburkholderia caffeinitolerans]|uniref:hypothetical protein n=1 Tax=Paraburkholderia caffeinitolerans TaxID=1723730 RepID=UPI003623D77B
IAAMDAHASTVSTSSFRIDPTKIPMSRINKTIGGISRNSLSTYLRTHDLTIFIFDSSPQLIK